MSLSWVTASSIGSLLAHFDPLRPSISTLHIIGMQQYVPHRPLMQHG
jgi:hypothetical protein